MGHVEMSRAAWRRVGLVGGAVAGAALSLSGVGSVATAAYFARRVVTPDQNRPDDTVIHDVATGADGQPATVTLEATPNTLASGRYGLWLDGGEGHVRLGEVLHHDAGKRRVTREVHGVDRGELGPGTGRWNGYYYGGTPEQALGLTTRDVVLLSDVGEIPAWEVPAEVDSGRWAVLVHGRSARRDECLRAVPTLHAEGWTCLLPMYRNDVGAPPSVDGRYNLGLAEWRDIEAAVHYALRRGAREVLLLGYSMGGAIVLQTLDRSWLADRVTRVILDGPVIDWGDVLVHQAETNRVPRVAESLARVLMGRRETRRLVGVHEPIDIAVTNWVARAEELAHPMLVIHSEEDEMVPPGPSRALARLRPDLVTYVPWRGARHCKEWNLDPDRWDAVVRAWLRGEPVPGAESDAAPGVTGSMTGGAGAG